MKPWSGNPMRITDYELPTPIVIDDALPNPMDDFVVDFMSSSHISWWWNNNISGSGDTIGLSHLFYRPETNWKSKEYDIVQSIPKFILERLNPAPEFTIEQARAFMHLKNFSDSENDGIHIDLPIKHIALLYYVNDSDGDTMFYGKNKTDPLSMRVTPKRNRAVLFDGSLYHASSGCHKSQRRIVINFDLT